MSEKLFSRLYWRPYICIGVSMLLVLLSSLAPYIFPRDWLALNLHGYGMYIFKGMAWLIKISVLVYLYSIYEIFAKKYFPKLDKLCTLQVRAVITEYKQTWTRGKQLCPVLTYTVGGREYSEALNEAHGERDKDGDHIEKGYTLKLPRKILCNAQDPRQFYISGEEYYSRRAAIVRYIVFSLLFFVQMYLNIFIYAR